MPRSRITKIERCAANSCACVREIRPSFDEIPRRVDFGLPTFAKITTPMGERLNDTTGTSGRCQISYNPKIQVNTGNQQVCCRCRRSIRLSIPRRSTSIERHLAPDLFDRGRTHMNRKLSLLACASFVLACLAGNETPAVAQVPAYGVTGFHYSA